MLEVMLPVSLVKLNYHLMESIILLTELKNGLQMVLSVTTSLLPLELEMLEFSEFLCC